MSSGINLTLILQIIFYIVIVVLLLKSKNKILKILGVMAGIYLLFSLLNIIRILIF